VGDGALTGGLAYEGLNNAGHLGTDLVIVLNDNSMSISPNVGSVSTYLTRLRSDPAFSRMKRDIEVALRRIPVVGDTMAETAERLKDSLKYALTQGALFEELGVRYFGPLDGHDIQTLRAVLERARLMRGPVLLHVVTKKGHGYGPAEADPGKFHGTGSFDPKTGKGVSKGGAGRPSWSQAFARALSALAAEDPSIVAITAAMADGTGLVEYQERFPNRFFDVGIAEAHAVTFAAGLATQGMKPVCAIYSTFLQRAYDQIIHDVAVQGLHVVFCLDRAGLVGEDGATHNGLYDLAYLRAVPGMTIAAPRDEADLRRMLAGALGLAGPMAIRYPRGPVPEPIPGPGAAFGEAEVLRTGPHATLVAVGSMVEVALEAADLLGQEGVRVGVVDARFVKPLDERRIGQVLRESAAVVTIEEGTEVGGFGEAVLHLANQLAVRTPVLVIAVPDRLFEHGTRAECLQEAGLTPAQVAARVGEWLAVRRYAS
jgi:1-deoxy-D-xylulose-5-phosphate synthase